MRKSTNSAGGMACRVFSRQVSFLVLWSQSTALFRGSGWAALALSSCLALGATTSIFFFASVSPDLGDCRLSLGPPSLQQVVFHAQLIANPPNNEIHRIRQRPRALIKCRHSRQD